MQRIKISVGLFKANGSVPLHGLSAHATSLLVRAPENCPAEAFLKFCDQNETVMVLQQEILG